MTTKLNPEDNRGRSSDGICERYTGGQTSDLATGEQLHVLGIPRVNLNEVFAITSKNGNDAVEVKLPYEMIIAAILPD